MSEVRTEVPTSHPQPMSPQDERTWAMLAHLSILANLVTGFLGVIAALLIFLIYKDRSRYVAYQSLQALVFQVIAWVAGGALVGLSWAITGILSAFLVGICLIPFSIILSLVPLGALVYGVIGAVQCNQGEDFRYWLVGSWFRKTYERS